MPKLTDARLRAIVAAAKPVNECDGEGLHFTLSAKGCAAWVLRYRIAGRRREVTLGRYPGLSLKAARHAAAVERLRVADGVDIATERRRAKHASASAWTVRKVADDFADKVLSQRAPATRKLWGGFLRNWIYPRLGPMIAADVTPADVVTLLRAVAPRGPGATRSMLGATRAVFKHARGLAIRMDNPTDSVEYRAIVSVTEPRKGATLTGDALANFLRAIPDDVKGDAIRLHLWTGQRPGELCSTPWAAIDLDAATWRVEGDRAKTGAGYTITLPAQAVEALRRIKAGMPASAYLFPAARGKDRPIPYQTYRAWLWRVLDRAGIDRKAFKPHDLRRTMRSGLVTLGVRYEVAERAINHKLPGLAEIYDRNDYTAERATALRQWADYLDGLRAGNNVVAIKARASA